MQGCEHGPFCARCQCSVAAQVLPFCVCRGLVQDWRETIWPSVSGGRGQGIAVVDNEVLERTMEAQGNAPDSPGHVLELALKEVPRSDETSFANAEFLSWDAFDSGAKKVTSALTPGSAAEEFVRDLADVSTGHNGTTSRVAAVAEDAEDAEVTVRTLVQAVPEGRSERKRELLRREDSKVRSRARPRI
eukprot:CAMPEP_0194508116 /NCGR_PEP_ID=MMETSP0253-20130528/38039_1 /TAXON_ID=2966 /ORGANISM="Noctiluca scintillans" /LENGTH=188 /DNA_ID=CAMNT_0039351105 /DNA_START=110 /DNA_END=676 /DNA_ORIENTATION=+